MKLSAITVLVAVSLLAQTNPGQRSRVAGLEVANQSTLGSNIMTNGTFVSDDGSWHKVGPWTIGSGVASVSSGPAAFIWQYVPAKASGLYQLTFTVNAIASSYVTSSLCSTSDSACQPINYRLTAGTYTELWVPSGLGTNVELALVCNAACTLSNISVKQVLGGNVAARGKFTGGGSKGMAIDPTTGAATFDSNVNLGTTTPAAPASPCNVSSQWSSNLKTVTPQMCGALADDSHDDKPAIDAAIATGLPVYLPTGTYKYSGKMSLGVNNRYLYGDAPNMSIIHFTDSTVNALVELTGVGYANVKIENLTLKGPGVGAGSNVHGIYSHANSSAPYGLRFRNVNVTDVSGNGFFVTDAFDTSYYDTWVERVGGDGHNIDTDQSPTLINSGHWSMSVGGYCWTIKTGAPFLQGLNCGDTTGGGAHFGNASPARYAHPTIVGMNIEGLAANGLTGILFEIGSNLAFGSGIQIYCNAGITCTYGMRWLNMGKAGILLDSPSLTGSGTFTNPFYADSYTASGALWVLGADLTAQANATLNAIAYYFPGNGGSGNFSPKQPISSPGVQYTGWTTLKYRALTHSDDGAYIETTNLDTVLTGDSTAGGVEVKLRPAANYGAGRTYTLKKIDASANYVYFSSYGTQTFDAKVTHCNLTAQWQTVTIMSNGSNWLILSGSCT